MKPMKQAVFVFDRPRDETGGDSLPHCLRQLVHIIRERLELLSPHPQNDQPPLLVTEAEDDRAQGRIFPALSSIRAVSGAVAVTEAAFEQGLAARDRPADLASWIYEPQYADYVEKPSARAS
jgi:hypothetical protein